MRKINCILKISGWLFPVFLVIGLFNEAWACWGNRPLAMGGAFTGLADDTNAIYWNPGGLGLYSKESITNTSNLGDENSSNYDQYLAFAARMTDKKSRKKNYGTVGFAFVSNETVISKSNEYKAEFSRRNRARGNSALTEDESFIDRDTYVQIGYGIQPFEKEEFAIGVSFKSVESEVDDPGGIRRNTEWLDLDVGAMWRFGPKMGEKKMFSMGFLFQNIGEAKLIKSGDGEVAEMIRNFRPGFSLKPDEHTVLSAELYDTFGATEGEVNDVSRNIRIGMEREVTDFLALRAGVYHLNNTSVRAYTGGVGVKLPRFWNTSTEFDVTIMHWDSTNNNTVFGGLTLLF